MTSPQTEAAATRTWEISDIDGSNPRRVSLADFLTFNAKKREEALAIFHASRAAVASVQP